MGRTLPIIWWKTKSISPFSVFLSSNTFGDANVAPPASMTLETSSSCTVMIGFSRSPLATDGACGEGSATPTAPGSERHRLRMAGCGRRLGLFTATLGWPCPPRRAAGSAVGTCSAREGNSLRLTVPVAGHGKLFHIAGCTFIHEKDGLVRSMTAGEAIKKVTRPVRVASANT